MGGFQQTSLMSCTPLGISGVMGIAPFASVEAGVSIAAGLPETDESCSSATSSYCDALTWDLSASIAWAPTVLPRLLGGNGGAGTEVIVTRREEARRLQSLFEQIRKTGPAGEQRFYEAFGNLTSFLDPKALFEDLQQGYPTPLYFLHNTGGTDVGFYEFVCGTPWKHRFFFVYDSHPALGTLQHIRTYNLSRGGSGLSMEIDLSPVQMMEWILQYPGGFDLHGADSFAVRAEYVKVFRDFLREQGVRPRIVIPWSIDPQRFGNEKLIPLMREHADVIIHKRRSPLQDGEEDAVDMVGLLEEARDRLSPETVRLGDMVYLAELASSREHGAEARQELKEIPFSEVLMMGPVRLHDSKSEQVFQFLRANGFGKSFFGPLYSMMSDVEKLMQASPRRPPG